MASVCARVPRYVGVQILGGRLARSRDRVVPLPTAAPMRSPSAAAFAALTKDYPETRVAIADLDKPEVFKTQTPEGKAARDAMWTEVKAS